MCAEQLKTDLLSLPASRELDALVAERVMGWTHCEMCTTFPQEYEDCPPYSTSIAAAWEVARKLELGVVYNPETHRFVVGKFSKIRSTLEEWTAEVLGEADTAPLAICRAALKAVEAA